jgi:glyceraldehyde 3-phosphate dehydrogenase
MVNVAINGFGRIGRMVFRAGWNDKRINFVAINDLTDTKTLASLLKYDSVHGKLDDKITAGKGFLQIGKKKIDVFSEKDPHNLPWKKRKIDVVVESTGRFRKPEDARIHINSGARKVLVSAPCKCPHNPCPTDTTTIVMGVNEKSYKKKHNIISNASCTTNCVAPILKVLEDNVEIKHGFFTTVHAYTATEHLVDGPAKDIRKGRAAAINIIPTSTGADVATIQAIPGLSGKIRGSAFRVPIVDGSVTSFSLVTKKDVTVDKINNLFKKAAKNKYKGIIEYSNSELVSTDIIHNPHSAIFDSKLTTVVDKRFIEIVAWYDNEWGYSNRMIDVIKLISK